MTIIADMEAMHHQVHFDPNDIDALKFMWLPDGDLSKQPEEYQMLVYLFGQISSSFCANYALLKNWNSNCRKVFDDIPLGERSKELSNII